MFTCSTDQAYKLEVNLGMQNKTKKWNLPPPHAVSSTGHLYFQFSHLEERSDDKGVKKKYLEIWAWIKTTAYRKTYREIAKR